MRGIAEACGVRTVQRCQAAEGVVLDGGRLVLHVHDDGDQAEAAVVRRGGHQLRLVGRAPATETRWRAGGGITWMDLLARRELGVRLVRVAQLAAAAVRALFLREVAGRVVVGQVRHV